MNLVTVQEWDRVCTRFGRFHDAELHGLRVEYGISSNGYDAVICLNAFDQESNAWIRVEIRLSEITFVRFQFDPESDYRFIRFEINARWSNGSVIVELGDLAEDRPTISDLLSSEKVLVGKSLVIDIKSVDEENVR